MKGVYECHDSYFLKCFSIKNTSIYYFIYFKKITFYINTLKQTKKINQKIKIYKNTVYVIKTNSS